MTARFHLLTLPMVIFSLGLFSMESMAEDEIPVLKIPRLKTEVKIDGNLTEACYAKHKPLQDFHVAADTKQRAPLTKAWVFWREDKIILAYECEDKQIVAESKSDNEMDVDLQDRVELFIWNGRPRDAYLCLELAPRGAVLDYSCRFYRKFDTSWNAKGLKVASVITKNGYRTEVELPADVVKSFGIKVEKGSEFRAGLFRGNRQTGSKDEEPMWITWVEAGVATPDFHIAESFGRFILVD